MRRFALRLFESVDESGLSAGVTRLHLVQVAAGVVRGAQEDADAGDALAFTEPSPMEQSDYFDHFDDFGGRRIRVFHAQRADFSNLRIR